MAMQLNASPNRTRRNMINPTLIGDLAWAEISIQAAMLEIANTSGKRNKDIGIQDSNIPISASRKLPSKFPF